MSVEEVGQDPVDHIRRATDHLQLANELLEDDGSGRAYIGEEHMTEALVALRDLTEARVEAKDLDDV